MRAFEIHTFQGGKWKIDSVFDDRDLAMFEARRMDSSARYAGVRVIEEIFDEETQQSVAKTIFRGTKADEAPQSRSKTARKSGGSQPKAGPRPVGKTGRARVPRKGPAEEKSGSGMMMIVVFLLLLLIGGGGLLFGLRFLEHAI